MTTPTLKAEVEAIVDSYLVHGVLPDQPKHREKLMQLAREVACATERRPAPRIAIDTMLRAALGKLLDGLPERRDWLDQNTENVLRAIRDSAPPADAEQLGDSSAVGRDMEGIEQPYAGAVVLLEGIAEFGATPFVDGAATPMRDDCLRLARGLRESARRAGEKSTITPDVKTGAGELSKLCETFGINVREGMTPMTAIACRLKDLQDAAARAAQPTTQADDDWEGHSEWCIGGKKGPCNCEAASTAQPTQPGTADTAAIRQAAAAHGYVLAWAGSTTFADCAKYGWHAGEVQGIYETAKAAGKEPQ